MKIGYFLSCEEYTPAELLSQAKGAEAAGFESLWISDHFHPWTDAQGNSPFVWSMIGAISQVTSLPITTAVTCPTIRTHPVVIAQAAATSAVLTGGNFVLGVGTGEALNEHITGSRWPATKVRLDMLEEAVEVMRELWTGSFVDHYGPHYTVENARLYTLPDQQLPVYVSGFGPRASAVAGRIGDGFVTVQPDADSIKVFRDNGGEGKPVHAGYKVCWGPDESTCVDIAHDTWPNESLAGEMVQTLTSPRHFEQAGALVTKDMTAESIPCGNDVDKHVAAFKPFVEAGADVIHIQQVGAKNDACSADGFFEFYRDDVLPRLRELG
jgi:G6PDH family F420-dependent oxidoreductase